MSPRFALLTLPLAAAALLPEQTHAACSKAALQGEYPYELVMSEYGRTICTMGGSYRFDGQGQVTELTRYKQGDCGGSNDPRSFRESAGSYEMDSSSSSGTTPSG